MNLLASSRLRLFIGAVFISLSPVWVTVADVSATTSGFYRVLFGGGALFVYLLATRRRLELSKRTWQLLIVASVFLVLDLWFGIAVFSTLAPACPRCSPTSRFSS